MGGCIRDTEKVDNLIADRRPLAENYYRLAEDGGD